MIYWLKWIFGIGLAGIVFGCLYVLVRYQISDLAWRRRLNLEGEWLTAYEEGAEAFEKGLSGYSCPYKDKSLTEAWYDGFDDAANQALIEDVEAWR